MAYNTLQDGKPHDNRYYVSMDITTKQLEVLAFELDGARFKHCLGPV